MSPPDPVLHVDCVSKKFTLFDDPYRGPIFKHLCFWSKKTFGRIHTAAKNISFKISKGETVGIIGVNGAGKTTLLKMIAGLLAPDSGTITVNGKVTAILVLGLAAHPEFTGRDNIIYNGLLLGMSKKEILGKLEQIIEFSELEKAIDDPFRTYSSGMRARLLFSTFLAVEPDILIIDEALATGDINFLKKCRQRIHEYCSSGATVLFVSHSVSQIQDMTQRSIVLQNGELIYDGPTAESIKVYINRINEDAGLRMKKKEEESSNHQPTQQPLPTRPEIVLEDGYFTVAGKRTNSLLIGDPCTLHLFCSSPQALDGVRFCIWIRSRKSSVTYAFLPAIQEFQMDSSSPRALTLGEGKSHIQIDIPQVTLGDGDYSCDVSFYPSLVEHEFTPDQAYCHVGEAIQFRAVYRSSSHFGRGILAELPMGKLQVSFLGQVAQEARSA